MSCPICDDHLMSGYDNRRFYFCVNRPHYIKIRLRDNTRSWEFIENIVYCSNGEIRHWTLNWFVYLNLKVPCPTLYRYFKDRFHFYHPEIELP